MAAAVPGSPRSICLRRWRSSVVSPVVRPHRSRPGGPPCAASRRDTELVRDRADRRPLRGVLALVLEHQPDGPLAQLLRIATPSHATLLQDRVAQESNNSPPENRGKDRSLQESDSAGEFFVVCVASSVPCGVCCWAGLGRGGWRLAMSLRPNGFTRIPAETARVARAAFPKGCLAMRARDEFGALFTDEQFAELFAARGRPAWSPARLALVLQFVEGLTDRQAADAVRGRLDWKYALGLELGDPGFDASVLTEFRARLLVDGQTERLLTLLLHRLQAGHRDPPRRAGGPGGGGACLAGRPCLARLGATLRPARRRLAAAHLRASPRRTGRCGWPGRLPAAGSGLRPGRAHGLAGVEAVQVLRATWIQQFDRDGGQVRWRDKHSGLPPGRLLILNPYDPDARPGSKRGRNWRGYKMECGGPRVLS